MPASARRRLAAEPSDAPIEVASASGCTIVDAKGRAYLDMTSGWCVANLGWSHPDIRRRLRRFDGPDYVSPHQRYAPWDELAARLLAIAPGDMARAFRATGGSEAVDLALQAAMRVTGRARFVALEGSYHGDTLATLGLIGEAPRRVGPAARRIKPPLDEKALGKLETALKRRDVAALVMEPIPINLGVEVPTPAFMDGAARLCKRYGTLLILDEVATGFGRTGTLFAAERYDANPDIICLAKGMTSGAAPMGAMLATERVAKQLGEGFQSYSTYGWHPLGVEAALACLDVWERDRARLLRNVRERSEQLRAGLDELRLGDVRAAGLAVAVEMSSAKKASRLAKAVQGEGVLLGASENVLQVMPPLIVTEDEAETALVAVERAAKLTARRS